MLDIARFAVKLVKAASVVTPDQNSAEQDSQIGQSTTTPDESGPFTSTWYTMDITVVLTVRKSDGIPENNEGRCLKTAVKASSRVRNANERSVRKGSTKRV